MHYSPRIVAIPDDAQFPILQRDPATGDIEFDLAWVQPILEANPDLALDEDTTSALLVAWYRALRATEFRDPLMEEIAAESDAEDTVDALRVRIGPGRST